MADCQVPLFVIPAQAGIQARSGDGSDPRTECGNGGADSVEIHWLNVLGDPRFRGDDGAIGDRPYRTTSGASISPVAKAARKALTTFGSNSAPEPFAMIALASKGDMAFR